MSDERLRTLERAWQRDRDQESELAFMREAVRVGHLTQVHLGAAAYLGHAASGELLGGDVPPLPGIEDVEDMHLEGEGLPERWATGLLPLFAAFDPEADRPAPVEGGEGFFADLAARVAGLDAALDDLIGAARDRITAGETPDRGALTQILFIATSKHVVGALGDDVSAVTERLLNFADVEVTAGSSFTGLGPVATQLADRAALAIKRLVVGTPSAKLLDQTRRVQRLLETMRDDVDSDRDAPWYEHVPQLTVLHLELADLTLRGQVPAWKPWLDLTQEWFGYQVAGVDDDAYYCVTAGSDLVYTAHCAGRLHRLEEIQAAVRDAVVPLLLRRGTDPLLEAPLPWLAVARPRAVARAVARASASPRAVARAIPRPSPSTSPGGTTRRFEHGGTKFWEIAVVGTSFTVRYGKVGANGRTQTKSYASAEDATREAEKKVREKTRKGYVEVGN